jgi:hypothetical protein
MGPAGSITSYVHNDARIMARYNVIQDTLQLYLNEIDKIPTNFVETGGELVRKQHEVVGHRIGIHHSGHDFCCLFKIAGCSALVNARSLRRFGRAKVSHLLALCKS